MCVGKLAPDLSQAGMLPRHGDREDAEDDLTAARDAFLPHCSGYPGMRRESKDGTTAATTLQAFHVVWYNATTVE